MNHLDLSIASTLDNLCRVEYFVENIITAFCVADKLRGSITLAIVEAANNAILHGNQKNPLKLVKFRAVKNKGEIVVTVEVEGVGFDYKNLLQPILPTNVQGMPGRGIYLMVTLSDKLRFMKKGAKVVMTFLLDE